MTALRLWDSEVIAAATETSDFDLAEVRHKPMTIFVCAEVADIRRLRPLFSLFFQQIIDFNTRKEFAEDPRNKHQLAMILDEFWAPGKMDVLADAAAFTASFGFRMLYVVQSKQQLHTIYGQEGAENIFLNTGAELLFGGADQRLAEEVSKRAGNDTVEATTTSRPRFMGWLFPAKQSENTAERGRALLLPQEVQRLPKDEMIVLRPTLPPLKLARIFWFSDPAFRGMGGDPPEVPQLHLHVERDTTPPAPRAEDVAEAAREQEEAAATAKAEEVRRIVEQARTLATDAAEAEMQTAGEARAAASRAAVAAEQARVARAEATGANHVARAATAALNEAATLGVVPSGIQAAADSATQKADTANAAAQRLAAEAADLAESARAAKSAATAASRAARTAEKRETGLARAAEQSGIHVQKEPVL
jgi:hypothetical protein